MKNYVELLRIFMFVPRSEMGFVFVSEKRMEGEDVVRTVDSLRGRLLAERMVSRNAKEEAELLGNKLIQLETMLKQEAKSRDRAERKLRFLIKKLESKNISYVSDESEQSILVDRSDISSVSSLASSSAKEVQQKGGSPESPKGSENMHKNGSNGQETEMELDQIPVSAKDSEDLVPKSAENSSNMDKHSTESFTEEGLNRVDDQDSQDNVDNSMALIIIDTPPKKSQTIDPEALDATVKEVLDALRHAKEQLQCSIEKRRVLIW
ncbi:hypothetical protein F511_04378 [Dorcoceras hygrometricum]|uniref:Uncharacterized protein n=1 Tax=Dorcoceras hygrometricum TaxID=472368 RepID=A0A2Z7BKB7_9LAMI|nr:hypothetical protein F511_04378 [Dorcoceras hygrometricum]